MSSRRDPRSRAYPSLSNTAAPPPPADRKRRGSRDDDRDRDRDRDLRDRDRDRTGTETAKENDANQIQPQKERTLFAVICASNMNRSMEAHHVLKLNGFNIKSYGTGSAVRLPGPTIDRPNVYPFGTPYQSIQTDLIAKDKNLYIQNRVLEMLERNVKTKLAPESWQDSREIFNVIFTCEERCYDAVLEEFFERGEKLNIPVHVINLEIRDNAEDAHVGGKLFLELATLIEKSKDHEHEMTDILESFQQRTKANLLHSICYF
ncbi:Ssu72-domain-containing protein [Rhizoclosmatium globosum]|uniref:RNA polymerase II subunit A C-terminal domain phosphatase SSU72 n=1 Tax=Rhizoclosmatium globosum TaxID=329046 RepID=A0A1Y2CNK3_9FUNG|nr:Ssu72-domain-containing protein [Rhizoclosmatium globosum]|eukprot:ORY48557.1 Ssu72-domain-containing protein [Rhizoclosmatium globosum]